MYKSDKNKH